MSNIFFVSDTHWHHTNILKYSSRDFSSVQEMNEALIKNWNTIVHPTDIVWHLGDFAFCKFSEVKNILRRLNGQINLIVGNHDQEIIKNKEELISLNLLKSVQSYKELKFEGKLFILFHYPIASWNKKHYDAICLHGHCHAKYTAPGKILDVGVDDKRITSEYRPLSIKEIINYMEKQSCG